VVDNLAEEVLELQEAEEESRTEDLEAEEVVVVGPSLGEVEEVESWTCFQLCDCDA
jgi:hypothetical protein